jgi:hypothetical protein
MKDGGHSEDLYVDGDIILKSVLKERSETLWRGCVCIVRERVAGP